VALNRGLLTQRWDLDVFDAFFIFVFLKVIRRETENLTNFFSHGWIRKDTDFSFAAGAI
jgi:hypothetical protein